MTYLDSKWVCSSWVNQFLLMTYSYQSAWPSTTCMLYLRDSLKPWSKAGLTLAIIEWYSTLVAKPHQRYQQKCQTRPPSEFTHSIRQLETISYWKASEFKSRLLHLSLPLLKDHLPSEYIYHLALLVCTMHILSSDCITPFDLSKVDSMLIG